MAKEQELSNDQLIAMEMARLDNDGYFRYTLLATLDELIKAIKEKK